MAVSELGMLHSSELGMWGKKPREQCGKIPKDQVVLLNLCLGNKRALSSSLILTLDGLSNACSMDQASRAELSFLKD